MITGYQPFHYQRLYYLQSAGNYMMAYLNASYTLLEKVLQTAINQNINAYTLTALKTKTGITGSCITLNYSNIFFSNPIKTDKNYI